MPGANERALEKAQTIPADALILDLEDAVAPDAKPEARERVCAAATSGAYGGREIAIRANGIGTAWHDDDLAAIAAAGPDAVVIPKINTRRRGAPDRAGARGRRGARPHPHLGDARDADRDARRATRSRSSSERLTVLVMGTNDLAKELQAAHVPGRQPLQQGLGLCLLAARAAGKVILDGVYNDIKDEAGFLAECEQGRDLGFDGKTLIHPSQVDPCNATFAPTAEDVERGRPHHRRLRGGRGRRARRRHRRRAHGGEPPRGAGPPHPGHQRGHRRARG